MGVPASKNFVVASGVAFLEPKFAREHDARASFGHNQYLVHFSPVRWSLLMAKATFSGALGQTSGLECM